MRHAYAALLFLLLALVTAVVTHAQEKPNMKIDTATRTRVIDGVLHRLTADYVFPEVARKMEAHVRELVAKGDYANVTDGPELAEKLTQDLRDVAHDLHLRVSYSPEVLPPDSGDILKPTLEEMEGLRRDTVRFNYGYEQVEILPGNIGYIRIRYFTPTEWSEGTIRSLFDFVANTDALIFDLRGNGGSMSEKAIPLVCSYLFEKPTHINSIYWRPTGRTVDFYTKAKVPGTRYLNKPVYVLTSGGTFSGAEEFAYDLKNLKRATIVGETTGGGANGGGDRRIDDHFSVWVPIGRAINPITKTNWEGVGVTPDVPVSQARALYAAHLLALKTVHDQANDTKKRDWLQQTIRERESDPPKLSKATFTLKGFENAHEVCVAGTFNRWSSHSNRLSRQGDVWTGEVETEPGRHFYKFIVDGRWIVDPANPATQQDGEYTNSVVIVPQP